MSITENFITSSEKQFRYYKNLAERCFNKINDESLFWSSDEKNNSIAVIVQHMHGNMLSRWTAFLEEDGEKEWRDRDAEFELSIGSRSEMMLKWEEGWHCLFKALDTIDQENIENTIYIRNMGHSVVEAIQRQLCHYAYHIGQIVYISKMVSDEWDSLSIPRGGSVEYNEEKFQSGKRDTHFTDDILGDGSDNG